MENIVVRRRAKSEIEKSFAYYEKQSLKVANEFMKELIEYVIYISNHPQRFRIVHKKYRVSVMKKFPFLIYFFIEKRKIVITSVFHSSRKPLKKYLK